MSNIQTFLLNNFLSVIVATGLIVLIAVGKVPYNVGLPLIVALTGVHIGAGLATTPVVTQTAPNKTDTTPTPPIQ